MTCIVGFVEDNKVYIGSDSCGSNHVSWASYENHKVFEVGDFLIGCTTSFRMIDLLTYSLVGCVQRSEDSDDKFIRTSFINSVKTCFDDGGFGSDNDGGEFLLGYKGRLYQVQGDFSVLNCPKWGMSVGSGTDAARGSLYTTDMMVKEHGHVFTPEYRIKKALEAAEAVIPSVRGPFIIKSK
jgi:hypothetical protein